jgi:hypothetical protein
VEGIEAVPGTVKGVGVMLGEGEGEAGWIAGIDLDTCRDPTTGAIQPWALDVLRRFNTYSEVSPSGTGVKLFPQIDRADIAALRKVMGTEHGRAWKRANGKAHPPAIELHISNRYFAVTWQHLDDYPENWRKAPLDDLIWLIEQAGPALRGRADDPRADRPADDDDILSRLDLASRHNKAIATALKNAATMKGGSRSEGAMGVGCTLRRAGWSYADVKAALFACPATREWAEKADERQFEHVWTKARAGERQEEPAADEAAEPGGREPIWIRSRLAREVEEPRRPWIVKDYLMAGAISICIGAPSAFKSTLLLGFAAALALGAPLGDFAPMSRCKVVVYNAEDDWDEQQLRLLAALRYFGASAGDIADKLICAGPNTIGTLLKRDDDGKGFKATAAMLRLEELLIRTEAKILILDPLIELHEGEENSNSELRIVMAAFRALAKRLSIGVLIAHHTPKTGVAEPGDLSAARGAGARSAAPPGSLLHYQSCGRATQSPWASILLLRSAASMYGWTMPSPTTPRCAGHGGLRRCPSCWQTESPWPRPGLGRSPRRRARARMTFRTCSPESDAAQTMVIHGRPG